MLLEHYLAFGWRSLVRDRLHTAISVAGLALGLTCFVGASAFVAHVRGADRGFPHSDRIHAIFQSTSVPAMGLELPSAPTSSMLLADVLRLELPELEAIARSRERRDAIVAVGAQRSYRRVRYAEPDFLRIFELPFVAGDSAAASSGARTAVLTQEAAAALFGSAAPLGGTLRVDDQDIAVAGVIGQLPVPSHLGRAVGGQGFEILVITNVPEDIEGPQAANTPDSIKWLGFENIGTYVLLPHGGSLSAAAMNARLPDIVTRRVTTDAEIALTVQPVAAIALQQLDDPMGTFGLPMSEVLLLLGAVVLGTAAVNFVNLAVARAATRAGEIGLRKTLGARRTQVVAQHLSESLLVATFAAVLAVAALEIIVPFLDGLLDLSLPPPHAQGLAFWLFLAAVTLAVGVAAGAYPALVLARARPVEALRAGKVRAGSNGLRTILIGLQFVAASFLLIAVTVMTAQSALLKRTALGVNEDPLVVIETPLPDTGVDSETFRSRLLASADIVRVTGANIRPWELAASGTGFSRTPEDAASFKFTQVQNVWYDYFDTLGIELVAGRAFSREHADGSEGQRNVVIDTLAVEQLGFESPADALGQTIYPTFLTGEQTPSTIVGVVEHAPPRVVTFGSRAFIYQLDRRGIALPIIQVSRRNLPAALSHIDSVWASLVPEIPLRREFADETFARASATFDRVSQAFVVLATFAFVIACMGLLGMVLFVTNRRRQEIGVRKVLGASSRRIFRLLMWDFLRPVLVANLIAWPLAFVAARRYLDLFMYRTELGPTPFVLSSSITLAIASSVVLVQARKSARVPPAALARYE